MCGDYEYEILEDGKSIAITKYIGDDDVIDVIVPSIISGYEVKIIRQYAFDGSIDWEDSGHRLENLESLTFSEGVEYLENGSVCQCLSLKKISFPSTFIGMNIVFSDGAVLPGFIYDCPVEKVEVSENNPYCTSLDDVLYNKDMTSIIYYPPKKETETYVVPNSVKSIYHFAFEYTEIQKVILPDSIEYIGKYSFSNSAIKQINIPSHCEAIDEGAFEYVNFDLLSISSDFTGIFFDDVFECCTLNSITVGEGNPKYSIVNDALVDNIDGRLITYITGSAQELFVSPENII